MKKKLEAELISIAHRILKLKNKSELHQLHQEAQNLYEKLTLLKFVEDHFAETKPTIGRAEIEHKIEAAFEAEPEAETVVAQSPQQEEIVAVPHTQAEEEKALQEEHQEVQPVVEEEKAEEEPIADQTQEETPEEIHEEVQQETPQEEVKAEEQEPVKTEEEIDEPAEENTFKPAFELTFETKDEEIAEQIKEEIKNVSPQITFDDLLGPDYKDPVFVKPEELEQEKAKAPDNVIPIGRSYNDAAPVISLNKEQGTSLNDRMSKGIIIGLNDRIAFMTHLFSNSSEDYNRVLSQLMTFNTFGEAKEFIDNMVKPDYNNWEGKEEYAERFMEIIEKRFS